MEKSIAVLVPCYNEAIAIEKVVADFKAALPTATIYVYDNNSTDNTFEVARQCGAVVRREMLQGKGNVIRRMFADIDADVYVMVDGDATYDAPSARAGHRLGNLFFTKAVEFLFGQAFTDILSGYRAFSRRFVKSFAATASGFETETELTVHSLQMRLRTGEVDTPYSARPEGSSSKLNTYRDGWRILKVIIDLIISERPLLIFGTLFLFCGLLSFILFTPIVWNYITTGLVPRFPTLFVAGFIGLFSILCLFFGYLYDRIAQTRREIKRMFYLIQTPLTNEKNINI